MKLCHLNINLKKIEILRNEIIRMNYNKMKISTIITL